MSSNNTIIENPTSEVVISDSGHLDKLFYEILAIISEVTTESEVSNFMTFDTTHVIEVLFSRLRKVFKTRGLKTEFCGFKYKGVNNKSNIISNCLFKDDYHKLEELASLELDDGYLTMTSNYVQEVLERKIVCAVLCGNYFDKRDIEIITDLVFTSRQFYQQMDMYAGPKAVYRSDSSIPVISVVDLMSVYLDGQNPEKLAYTVVRQTVGTSVDEQFLKERDVGEHVKNYYRGESVSDKKTGLVFSLKYVVTWIEGIPMMSLSTSGKNIFDAISDWVLKANMDRTSTRQLLGRDGINDIMTEVTQDGCVISVNNLYPFLDNLRQSDECVNDVFIQNKSANLPSVRIAVKPSAYITIKRTIGLLIMEPTRNLRFTYLDSLKGILKLLNVHGLLVDYDWVHSFPYFALEDITEKDSLERNHEPYEVKSYKLVKNHCDLCYRLLSGLHVSEEPAKDIKCRCGYLFEDCFVPLDSCILLFKYHTCPFCYCRTDFRGNVRTRQVALTTWEISILKSLYEEEKVGLHSFQNRDPGSCCNFGRIKVRTGFRYDGGDDTHNASYMYKGERGEIYIFSDFPNVVRFNDHAFYKEVNSYTECDFVLSIGGGMFKFLAVEDRNHTTDIERGIFEVFDKEKNEKVMIQNDTLMSLSTTQILTSECFLKKPSIMEKIFGPDEDTQIFKSPNSDFCFENPDREKDFLNTFLKYLSSNTDPNYQTRKHTKKHKFMTPNFSLLMGIQKNSYIVEYISQYEESQVSQEIDLTLVMSAEHSYTYQTSTGNKPVFPQCVFHCTKFSQVYTTDFIIKELPPGYFVPLNKEVQIICTSNRCVADRLKGTFCGIFVEMPQLQYCYYGYLPNRISVDVENILAIIPVMTKPVNFMYNHMYCPNYNNNSHTLYFESNGINHIELLGNTLEIKTLGKTSCLTTTNLRLVDDQRLSEFIESSVTENLGQEVQWSVKLGFILYILLLSNSGTEIGKFLMSNLPTTFRFPSYGITNPNVNSSVCFSLFVKSRCGAFPIPFLTRKWNIKVLPLKDLQSLESFIYKMLIEIGIPSHLIRDMFSKNELDLPRIFSKINAWAGAELIYDGDFPQLELQNSSFLNIAQANQLLIEERQMGIEHFIKPNSKNQLVITPTAIEQYTAVCLPSNHRLMHSYIWDMMAFTVENGLVSYETVETKLKSDTQSIPIYPRTGEFYVETNFRRRPINTTAIGNPTKVSAIRYILDNDIPQPTVQYLFGKLVRNFGRRDLSDNFLSDVMLKNAGCGLLQNYWSLKIDTNSKKSTIDPNFEINAGEYSFYRNYENNLLPFIDKRKAVLATTCDPTAKSGRVDQNLPFCIYAVLGEHVLVIMASIGRYIIEKFRISHRTGVNMTGNPVKRFVSSNTLVNFKKSLITGYIPPQLTIALWSILSSGLSQDEPAGFKGKPYGITADIESQIYLKSLSSKLSSTFVINIDQYLSGALSLKLINTQKGISLHVHPEKISTGLKPKFAMTNADRECCDDNKSNMVVNPSKPQPIVFASEILTDKLFSLRQTVKDSVRLAEYVCSASNCGPALKESLIAMASTLDKLNDEIVKSIKINSKSDLDMLIDVSSDQEKYSNSILSRMSKFHTPKEEIINPLQISYKRLDNVEHPVPYVIKFPKYPSTDKGTQTDDFGKGSQSSENTRSDTSSLEPEESIFQPVLEQETDDEIKTITAASETSFSTTASIIPDAPSCPVEIMDPNYVPEERNSELVIRADPPKEPAFTENPVLRTELFSKKAIIKRNKRFVMYCPNLDSGKNRVSHLLIEKIKQAVDENTNIIIRNGKLMVTYVFYTRVLKGRKFYIVRRTKGSEAATTEGNKTTELLINTIYEDKPRLCRYYNLILNYYHLCGLNFDSLMIYNEVSLVYDTSELADIADTGSETASSMEGLISLEEQVNVTTAAIVEANSKPRKQNRLEKRSNKDFRTKRPVYTKVTEEHRKKGFYIPPDDTDSSPPSENVSSNKEETVPTEARLPAKSIHEILKELKKSRNTEYGISDQVDLSLL